MGDRLGSAHARGVWLNQRQSALLEWTANRNRLTEGPTGLHWSMRGTSVPHVVQGVVNGILHVLTSGLIEKEVDAKAERAAVPAVK
jgi:hypothetical protein